MRRSARLFRRSTAGSVGAEFALVLPLLLFLIFGIIDVGRAMWTWNKAEKATQAGVRFAVATDVLPTGMAALSFEGVSGITRGQVIPASAFGRLSCTRTTCTCEVAPCYSLTAMNSTGFDAMMVRIRANMPEVTASNVRIVYESSGLGYAGDPGIDISPLVTVKLVNMQFHPVTLLVFGATIAMPAFPATLSLEDGAGTLSN